jgi:hypothetical protein
MSYTIKVVCTLLALSFVNGCKTIDQYDESVVQEKPGMHRQSQEDTPEIDTKTTFARFVPERKDDFAWENDKVAFRMYGPAARSGSENAGLDCWLKRVETPIINKWYKQELEQGMSYHKDWGEGLDNYHVGSSAGCGSSALWIDGKRTPLETFVDYKIIVETQHKTVFVLFYRLTVNGDVYEEQKEIEIELGHRLFKATSTFWKNGVLAKGLPIAVGVTTHDENVDIQWQQSKGYIAGWEVKEGFGLGTGVIVNPKNTTDYFLIQSKGVKDTGHALAILSTNLAGRIEYYAGYGWEKAQEITAFELWQAYLDDFATTKASFIE